MENEGTFVETKGTVFYGRHHNQETILECLAWPAERNSLAASHRVKGIKEETVSQENFDRPHSLIEPLSSEERLTSTLL